MTGPVLSTGDTGGINTQILGNRRSQNNSVGQGDGSVVKCLPHKHEDLSSNPQSLHERPDGVAGHL